MMIGGRALPIRAALILAPVFLGAFPIADTDWSPQYGTEVLRVGYSAGAFSKAFLQEAKAVLQSLGTTIAKRTTETFREMREEKITPFKPEYSEASRVLFKLLNSIPSSQ
ncbi:MAG: hypothetical protein A2W03_06870 [Candidatus Aminicenantes bacterium RBG_16_63_16]|nr:MAG: hypothetical protein A2W03_06870 [Candidatus Aminicenantes bacterium RBG_16_63_16]